MTTEASAQARTVTGRVTSAETNLPLVGVTVLVQGTTTGTTTNSEGRYSINAPAGATTLVFSLIGYAPTQAPISGSTVDVQLAPQAVALQGVVVTALGIERQERTVGVAAQQVQGEELSRVETNIVNSLSGKIAGVNISNSGPQGGSSRIVIRGDNSVTGNNQPLFIVDGVPIDNYSTGAYLNSGQGGFDYGNAVQDINPEAIASITVLKGPNAAALYGSRASNGAVIITTKNGSDALGGTNITASQLVTVENELRLPDYQNVYGQGHAGQFSYYDGYGNGVYDDYDESWGPPLDVGLKIPQFNSPIDPATGQRVPTPWVSHPGNVDEFFQTGRTLTTNVSVAAATEKMHGRFGATRLDQKGIVPGFGLERTNLSFGGGISATSRLKVNSSIQYISEHGDNRPGVGYDENNPGSQFVWFGRNVDMNYLRTHWDDVMPEGDPFAGYPVTWNYIFHPNPYYLQLGNGNSDSRDRLIGQLSASYEFTPWLSGTVQSGTDWYQDGRQKTYGALANKIAGLYTTNPLTLNREYVGNNGAFGTWDIGFQETNTSFLLNANPELNLPFSVSATFGGNRRDYQRSTNYTWVGDLATPGVFNVANAAVTPDPFSSISRKRVNSLYGEADLGYNDYLYLTFTGRNDWSSTLPEDNRSYFYPSVSSSLIFTDLIPSLQESNFLSYGKLRASWARVGNDTDPYNLRNTFSASDKFGELPTYTIPGLLLNAGLKPETTESWEFGTELGFLNNRLGLDLTYYQEQTFDQIMPVEISRATGYTSRLVNAGTVQNRGVEVLLRGTPLQTNDFSWETTVSWAKNNNKVVELAPGLDGLELSQGDFWGVHVYAREGEPLGQLMGAAYQRDPQGQIVVSKAVGVPLWTNDLQVLGNYNPDWRAGWNNDFHYKGATLHFLFDWKKGGEIYSVTNAFGQLSGVLKSTLKGRCTPAGDLEEGQEPPQGYPVCTPETGIVVPGVNRVVTGGDTTYVPNETVVDGETYFNYLTNVHEAHILDAGFVKLREATLSYDVPNRFASRLGLSGLQVALVGRNLLMWTKNDNIDPESGFDNTNVQGFEYGQMPTPRSIGFNITVHP
jgi:TonB-linked SusC/RagA family outer membrane protein